MTQHLESNKPESRAIYWLRYFRRGMELPSELDLMSFTTAKQVARKLKRKGYRGEIFEVPQVKDALGWGVDGMNVKVLWMF